ncbi:MAG: PTS sugar transporter subunit IIA [Chloroflexi bacterium]|nr:PTS sugar transporter subunit IIA [Chloroflexota bacterium]
MVVGLLDLLNEKTIRLDAEAADWPESVRLAGTLLVDIGAVSPSYVDAMVRVVEELGPYMVVAPGIALAHARPEDGVKRMCMSLVSLASPVEFGSEANDPVDLVFAFGAVDKNAHIEVLKDLATFLQHKEAVVVLRCCKSASEVARLIEKYSEYKEGQA